MKRSWLVVAALAAAACSSSSNGATSSADSGAADAGADTGDDAVADAAPDSGSQCSAAIEQTLHPIDRVATTNVAIVSTSGATRTVYVDATAGGSAGATNNPYIYVNLETATRVDVTDKTARSMGTWDLALKRYVVFTNSGDGGSGMGGATTSMKTFDTITAADATDLKTEAFFDANCNELTDQIGGLRTTFSNWYSYDQQTNQLTPAAGVFIVRGGTGKLYKVQILNYYATPDGGTGTAGGDFLLQVAAL